MSAFKQEAVSFCLRCYVCNFIGCGSFLCSTYFVYSVKRAKSIHVAWKGELKGSSTNPFLVTKIRFSTRSFFEFLYTRKVKKISSLSGISVASMAMTTTSTTIANTQRQQWHEVIHSSSYSQQNKRPDGKLMLIEVHTSSVFLPIDWSLTLPLPIYNKSLSIHIVTPTTNVRCIRTTIQSQLQKDPNTQANARTLAHIPCRDHQLQLHHHRRWLLLLLLYSMPTHFVLT